MEAANIGSDELPGLTLHVMEDELTGCAGKTFKAGGRIVLSAEVHNLDIFDEVKEKLDGMTVHTVNDVPQALVRAAQRRAKRAEQKMMDISEDTRKRVDELEAQLSFALQERDNFKGQLEQALAEKKSLEEALEWADESLQSRSK